MRQIEIFSNIPPSRNSRELNKHFSKTYISLRVGLIILAFSMPFSLYLYGKLRYGLDLQSSMSAYFWAATQHQCASFPMRTIFVGYLFAVGVGLFVYRGLTNLENSLLNMAAVCVFVIALYPESIDPKEALTDPRIEQLFTNCPAIELWANQAGSHIHTVAATLLFVLLAAVAWFCAHKSLEYLPPGHDPNKYKKAYKANAIAMLLFPLIGFALAFVFGQWPDKVFFVEATGLLTFGTYWLVKTRELQLSSLECDPEKAVCNLTQLNSREDEAEGANRQA